MTTNFHRLNQKRFVKLKKMREKTYLIHHKRDNLSGQTR